MQTVNAKELFGFLPHQSLEVYTGTIHAKKNVVKRWYFTS